jgi:hypothetical protein
VGGLAGRRADTAVASSRSRIERTKYLHGCPTPSIAGDLVDGPVWELVCEVLRNPAMIERELAKQRSGGGVTTRDPSFLGMTRVALKA